MHREQILNIGPGGNVRILVAQEEATTTITRLENRSTELERPIDALVRVSLVGIDLITVEARVVVASIDTYLRYAEAMGITAPVARPPLAPATPREQIIAAEAIAADRAARERET